MGIVASARVNIKRAAELAIQWLTDYMRLPKVRARKLANWLNSSEHKSHAKPLSAKLLDEKGMKIEYLEDNQELQNAVLSVFHALMHTFDTTPCVSMMENHLGKGLFAQSASQFIQAGQIQFPPVNPFFPAPSPVPNKLISVPPVNDPSIPEESSPPSL